MTAGLIVCERDAGSNMTSLTSAADIALDSDRRTVEGLGSAYDVPYPVFERDGSRFIETMRYGVFAESLRRTRPVSQWMHSHDPAVGSAPILKLDVVREQKSGLYFRGTLLDAPQLDLIRAGLRAGEINAASIRFVPEEAKWSTDRSRKDVLKASLLEVGLVVHPANPAAQVTLRHHRLNGDKPAPLSARAERWMYVWRRGVATWAEIPSVVQAELRAKVPNKVDALRSLEAGGGLKPSARAASVTAGMTRRDLQREAVRVLTAGTPKHRQA